MLSGSSRWRQRALLVGALLLGSALRPAAAEAKQTFPGKLQKLLATKNPEACVPSCLLCHTDPAGGLDKYRNSAAAALGIRVENDDATLLDSLADANTDKDDKTDLDELLAGTDPFTANSSSSICTPEYGCGARVAPAPPTYDGAAGAAAIFAAAVAGYFIRRPRRPARS